MEDSKHANSGLLAPLSSASHYDKRRGGAPLLACAPLMPALEEPRHAPLWTTRQLTGWGRSCHSSALTAEPRCREELLESWRQARQPILARGAGRSYGDAALNGGGQVIDTTQLKAIESFDDTTGEAVVEPGVTFGDLLRQFAARGWIAAVTPGTQFVTIAGAIANDVHGKNHDRTGSFCDHVQWIELLLPDGTVQRLDAGSPNELFLATVGGIGLTGIITRASIRLKRIPSTMLRVRQMRMRDLSEFLEALEAARRVSEYSVGWIDGTATGKQLGRGILETAEHTDGPAQLPIKRRMRMPVDLPGFAINPLSVKAFNALYYRRVPSNGRERRLDMETFFYPLDAVLQWNRIYGRRGFVQFQCVIPDEASRSGMRTLLTRVSDSGAASFLAVIKTLGRAGRGYLSFARPGVTLALDFPLNARTPALLDSLHELTIAHGGRVYLAKDSCLDPLRFHRMYPRAHDFAKLLAQIDPDRKIRSDMSRRLRL